MYRGRDTLAAPIRFNPITEPELPRHPPEQPPLTHARGLLFRTISTDPRDKPKDMAQDGSLKGGDPAAGSPTATLLRLHPSR